MVNDVIAFGDNLPVSLHLILVHCQEKDPKNLKILKKERIKINWVTTVSLRAVIAISSNLPFRIGFDF